MKKHEKKRIQGIKAQQKLFKTFKKITKLDLPHNNAMDDTVFVVQKLSIKQLKLVLSNLDYFISLETSGLLKDLERLAKDELVLRQLKISK